MSSYHHARMLDEDDDDGSSIVLYVAIGGGVAFVLFCILGCICIKLDAPKRKERNERIRRRR